MQHAIHAITTALPWYFPVCAFIVGACIGSFLNVCIVRLPLGESVVRPRSHCRSCGAPIRWHDNIPILSWFILRGRSRCCKTRFSFRYPFIELLTALLFVACWQLLAPVSVAKAICGMVFVSALIGATFTDIDHYSIPDVFTIGLCALGLTLSFLVPSLHLGLGTNTANMPGDMLRSGLAGILGGCIGSAVLYWTSVFFSTLLRKPVMGDQDVLLLGAIGVFCGWRGALFALFAAALLATVFFAVMTVYGKISGKKILVQPLNPEDAPVEFGVHAPVPLGPFLAAGAVLYFLWLHPLVDAWFAKAAMLIR